MEPAIRISVSLVTRISRTLSSEVGFFLNLLQIFERYEIPFLLHYMKHTENIFAVFLIKSFPWHKKRCYDGVFCFTLEKTR